MTSSSYMLERELLGSARNIIDANSNSPFMPSVQHTTYRSSYGILGSSPYVPASAHYVSHGCVNTCPTDNYEPRKALADLQDQIHLLKQDLEKKDILIQELTSVREGGKHFHFETAKYEALVGQERASYDAARRELDLYRTKVDGLTHDLRETAIKSSAKDERINEMRHELDTLKSEHELMNQSNNQLRLRVRELESNMNSYESIGNKSSFTISALQKECKDKQDQVFELQSRIRTHMEEREAYERRNDGLTKKLQELFAQVGMTLGTDFGLANVGSSDILMNRIADMNSENISLKGKLIKLEETLRVVETESQANRATIQQMSNQLNSFDHNNLNYRHQLDSMRAERDSAFNDREAMRRELETVQSRLDSVQKAWQNTRGELDQRENRFSTNELHLKQLENDLGYARSCFEAFKQQVGQLLSDGYVKVESKEEEIKEKIQLLMQSSKDRGLIITNLQNQKEQLAKQLQDQIDANKDADSKRRHTESHIMDLENRVKTLDNNYTTTEVYRENLQQDKAKFLHFLERLSSIMKVDNVTTELGYELNPDVLLSRAEQLMRLESNSITDQKTSIYGFQRKIKQMKEQMENKDLHMDLLRKKVIALEEGRAEKTDLEREIDDHVFLSRKMKVKVEHLTHQVNDLKCENTQLKAQMTDVQTLKGHLIEREKEVRRLVEDISKLEGTRDRQAVKISSLQDKVHSVDDEANRTLNSSDNAVRALSNELRFLKGTLEQFTERERRLLDFRALVARMLGLDAKTLSVPDYEITARLERLLTVAQPSMLMPMVPVHGQAVKPAFIPQPPPTHHHQHQYQRHPHQHVHSAHGRHRSPSPANRRAETNHRARSLSPLQVGIDPRMY